MTEKGLIHSIQTLGTVDGPGVRYVVFFQGCPLRCKCCHNPDTWEMNSGKEYSASELVCSALRYREYFGKDGGVTASGGEPLMQSDFLYSFFDMCHKENINTCLDTSGCILNEKVKQALSCTDRVLLDVKYLSEDLYHQNVGCSLSSVMQFLDYLEKERIPSTLRQVIIPGINDDEESVQKLLNLARSKACVDKIELLPFKNICITKYDNMNLEFPFRDIPVPKNEKMNELKKIIFDYL